MADTDRQLAVWDGEWEWSRGGEEWSEWAGGTAALWYGELLPRLHAFLPSGTILEIGPGFGRWTEYLKDRCDRLVLVDLAERCISHCRERFGTETHLEYHVNDGRSLEMVEEATIDLAFSFDSLVHADGDVIEAYLGQLARKLKPDGVAFIHHSNLGAHRTLTRLTHRTPPALRRRLIPRGVLIDIGAWRAEDVTVESVAAAAERAGLACVSQERIRWQHGRRLTDALSLLTPRGWSRPRERRVLDNREFGSEARRIAALYDDPWLKARLSSPGASTRAGGA